MANTTYADLYVTDDGSVTFKTWREQMNATTNSNMTKIDDALAGLATTAGGKQATITASGILKGNGSGTITAAVAGTDYAAASHNHNASAINAGTLGVARGGTGRSTLTSGSYLVGAGTSQVALKTPAEVRTNIGACAATEYTGTFLANGWAADTNGYYTQTINISGLAASYSVSPQVGVVLSGTNKTNDTAALNAFSRVGIFDTGSGTLKAMCMGSAPTDEFQVKVVVFT